jgi:hypothetical protein
MTGHRSRRGLSVIEVVVVLAVLVLVVLLLVMLLPRQRESQRFAECQMNLRQFGLALAFYDHAIGHLPTVPDLALRGPKTGDSPHVALLDQLGLPDFRELDETKATPGLTANLTVTEHPVAGFICPSDKNATAGLFPAPISYRATTGSAVTGHDGAFAPGRRVSITEVEAADGSGYTTAFAERLLGENRAIRSPNNYAVVTGPLNGPGCRPEPGADWRGDAGASWWSSRWSNTLYNHALRPNQWPSCVAEDARSAAMGASSGHVGRVNVLLLDGGVRPYTPNIDTKVWKGLAATHDSSEIEQEPLKLPLAGENRPQP